VHLGIGAFHRAHQAMVNDLAVAATGDTRWGIVGISLRSPDTRDALQPQRGLYTVALRDADAAGAPRESLSVVGSVMRVLVAPENPGAAVAQIAHPDTRIVSLTITEKGYCHDPASGRLRLGDPDIAHDLAHAAVPGVVASGAAAPGAVAPGAVAPRTALGLLVSGLARRRDTCAGPVTLLSCDNLPSNGDTLRAL